MERLELKGVDPRLKSKLKILASSRNQSIARMVEPTLKKFVNEEGNRRALNAHRRLYGSSR